MGVLDYVIEQDFSKFHKVDKVVEIIKGLQEFNTNSTSKGSYTYASAIRYVDKNEAESKKIPHAIVFCLTMKPNMEILRTRISSNDKTYPNYNSIPSTHVNVYLINDEERHEPGYYAAIRGLYEETGLRPFRNDMVRPILSNKWIEDVENGHVGFVYFIPVLQKVNLKYSNKLNPEKSGFFDLETIKNELRIEKFTPLTKMILELFIEKYPTIDDIGKSFFQFF